MSEYSVGTGAKEIGMGILGVVAGGGIIASSVLQGNDSTASDNEKSAAWTSLGAVGVPTLLGGVALITSGIYTCIKACTATQQLVAVAQQPVDLTDILGRLDALEEGLGNQPDFGKLAKDVIQLGKDVGGLGDEFGTHVENLKAAGVKQIDKLEDVHDEIIDLGKLVAVLQGDMKQEGHEVADLQGSVQKLRKQVSMVGSAQQEAGEQLQHVIIDLGVEQAGLEKLQGVVEELEAQLKTVEEVANEAKAAIEEKAKEEKGGGDSAQ